MKIIFRELTYVAGKCLYYRIIVYLINLFFANVYFFPVYYIYFRTFLGFYDLRKF